LIVFLLSFRYTNNHIQPRDLLTESNFRLRIMFQEDKKPSFEADLRKYLKELTIEQKQKNVIK
jgi:hypothetical protein